MDSSSHFGYELMSLDRIFEDEEHEKRIFRIPEYQRGYSWEKQQRTDLFRDIELLIKAGCRYRHYTGTIVVASGTQQKEGGYRVFDLVDGQQRVTTLILLLSTICRVLGKSGKQSKADEICRKFIKDGDIGNTVFKLKLGRGLGSYFESLLEKGSADASDEFVSSKSHQNLRDAVEECQAWIKKQDDVDAVLLCVREKLGFLVYAPKQNSEIGIMFEVINNRGKPLSELEKIKNYLIYFSEKNEKRDIKKRVEDSWPEIMGNLNRADSISNEDENAFLRNCWIVFWDSHKARSYHVYDNLKKAWPPDKPTDGNVRKITVFIDFLKNASIHYAKYQTGEGVTGEEKSWLERIRHHPADASITPLILAISDRVENQDNRNNLFELLEKLNFRYYGTNIAGRSDTGQGHLFWLAHQFFNYFEKEFEGVKIGIPWLSKELIKFIHEHANDKKFIEYLTLDKDESGDYYEWNGLKYFLASYEQCLQEKQRKSIDLRRIMAPRNQDTPNDFFHNEHIWARKDYSRIDDSKYLNVNKRRLGNFMLLNEGLNIKVSNLPPEAKIKEYFKVDENTPNTLMIRELKGFFDKAEKDEFKSWDRRTDRYWLNTYTRFLDMREERMVNFALERWRIPNLDDNISKVELDSLDPKRNEIYTTIP